MLQKIIIAALVLLCTFTCFAQEPDQEQISKAVNIYNYAIVSYALVNGTSSKNDFDYSFYDYAQKYGNNDTIFDRIKKSIPISLAKTRVLCDEIESIKTEGNINQGMNSFLYYLIYNSYNKKTYSLSDEFKYPLLHEYYSKWEQRKKDDFINFKKTLYNRLKNKLNTNSILEGNSPPENSTERKTFLKDNGATLLIILGTFGLLIVLVSFINSHSNLKTKFNSYKELAEKELNASKNKTGEVSKQLIEQQKIFERNEKRLFSLEELSLAATGEDLLKQKKRIELLENELNKINAKSKETVLPSQPSLMSKKVDVQKVLFFPAPDKKTGRFRAVMGKETIYGYSVYEFFISKQDETKADFSLIQNPLVEAAVLNFPELYLQHACEARGEYSVTKKIKSLECGKASLEGDYWVIIKKAMISYV